MSKPLFVPLKGEYFDAFVSGAKQKELRRYGPRWNEKTCPVGRDVILSRGYGKKHRAAGRISHFERRHGSTFSGVDQAAILDVYGTLQVEIACVSIKVFS